ncbi:MAG TPA: GH92 family glycosyl hydrolase [Trebonia sp.]|nr:GH92 family glycosyl hydrolase [Trebonia sp.]
MKRFNRTLLPSLAGLSRPGGSAGRAGLRTGRAGRRATALVVGIGAAALLALGTAAAGSASAATPSPRASASATPSPSASPTSAPNSTSAPTSTSAPSGGSATSGGAGGSASSSGAGSACVKGNNGRLANCPGPVPSAKLPASARSKQPVPTPVSDPSSLVDTRTWTTGGGNTFPGAEYPFGMVQWSPDTSPDRSAGGGYSYGDAHLMGYSLTHVSGPGCGAGGDVPILPMTGALPSGNPNNVLTSFTNDGEVAQAGYYQATSNGPAAPITSAFTATPHASLGQFTFPRTSAADFLIKLQDSQNGDNGDSAQVVGDDEVIGSDTSGGFCGEGNNDGQVQQYTVNFDIKFSQPFTASQVITASGQAGPQAVFLTFDTTANPVIDANVAISYVSTANAQANRQAEAPGWNFASAKAAAQSAWNALLLKMQVAGGTLSQTQEFYSLLYKDLLQPNITSDVNGQYTGSDGEVHTVSGAQQDQYGIYSGWDIYHSLSQLQAILDPQVASDQAQSLVNYYDQNGILQQWGYLNLDNYVMVGDPAQSVIADSYAFGAKDFDTSGALADMLKQATTVNDVRPGEALEDQYGYLPEDGSYGCCNSHGQVSTLLEYDTEDLALSQFAKALGDKGDSTMLEERANNWQNVFDPNDDLLGPRDSNGQFVPGITATSTDPYVEGDAYEYLWNVPNDYQSLFALMGGDSKVVPELEQYLSQPNGFGTFAQLSNEFDFGEQYALNYAGDPAGTQTAVAAMLATMYPPGPSGLPNNDDLGANSSTYIWEMLGLYPENSGTGTLDISGPHFPYAKITLANGKAVTINAPAASSSDYYIKSLKVNGQAYKQDYIDYSDLTHGATLSYTMTARATNWGSGAKDVPPSYAKGAASAVGYLPAQQVDVTPGGSATAQVGARDASGARQSVTVQVKAPAGLTVRPAAGTIKVPANGSGTVSLTVTAKSSAAQTFYNVPVTVKAASGGTQTLNLLVLVAPKGSLLTAFSNAGIADDASPGGAEFDTSGFSYSAQALAAAGLVAGQPVTAGGVQFTWPLPAPGFPDNAIADGQQVSVSAPAGTQTLGFLGAASNGPSRGIATLHYSDGSSSQFWLGLSDWTLNGGGGTPSYGDAVAASTPYRDGGGGQQQVGTDVFYTALPVDGSKTLTSVTLPAQVTAGALHVFAVGTSTAALSPLAASLSATSAPAGQQVTITGSGFGATQGSGYVAFSDNDTNWGAPGNTAAFQVSSWSDTAVTFTVPTPSGGFSVSPGTFAAVSVTSASGATSDLPVLEITPTANPADYYDNVGISPDDNQSCSDFDGNYAYSADALAAAGLTPGGTFTADGLSFTWPDAAACASDNILADGQVMLVHAAAGATTLGLVGASGNGSATAPVTITYTDGTSDTQPVTFNDWANGPSAGDTAVATMSYRNQQNGSSQSIPMYVYATTVPVNPAKTVASITYPDVAGDVSDTAMHIFAVSLGSGS